MNLHDQTALVERYSSLRQVGEHIVRNGSRFDMVEEGLHWRRIEKVVILSVELEVVRVEVDDERRGVAVVLL